MTLTASDPKSVRLQGKARCRCGTVPTHHWIANHLWQHTDTSSLFREFSKPIRSSAPNVEMESHDEILPIDSAHFILPDIPESKFRPRCQRIVAEIPACERVCRRLRQTEHADQRPEALRHSARGFNRTSCGSDWGRCYLG